MHITALSTILFSLLALVTGVPLRNFGDREFPTFSEHNYNDNDALQTRDPTPYATIQFNLVTNEESYQFGFGLGDLATINAGQQKALKNAVASIQVLGDGKCDIFADQGGDALLAEGVGNEAVILRDGTGVAVGAVKCT